ncbi:MAG: TIGR00730 family Rossman fold protein [Alphaproteobacteria bacterium]|nr:TIGR00730 family Rossman fold protein [Alphaproteobacteria bacterium]
MSHLTSVCVYCGSSNNGPTSHREAANALGKMMAERGIGLVYGGGRAGVMGAVADSVLSAGGKVTGIIPDFLMRHEVGHMNITELEVVDTMHARKARMAELSDAFLILPGGLGTLEEYFEIVTWRQLGLHDKPIAVLNTDGYWDRLRDTVNGIVEANYARPESAAMTSYVGTAEQALDTLERQISGSEHLSSEML